MPTLQLSEKRFKPEVPSHGYSDASVFLLGGFPTNEDLRNEKALSGSQEDILRSFLKEQKIDLKKCYRSLFIKEGIGYAGTAPKKIKKGVAQIDTEKYLDLLFDEIKDVNPNVIVPLDDISLGAVFPHIQTINKPKGRRHFIYCYRGSILPLRHDFQSRLPATIKVIPTFGPQLLNVDYTARAYVKLDYKRIKDNQYGREQVKDFGTTWIARNAQDLHRFFLRGLEKNDGFVTFDVETYMGFLTCISFCFDGLESCSVPLSPYYYSEISSGEMALMWQLVGRLLNHKIPKCNQNIKYDWIILERHGFNVRSVQEDTMLKAGLLYPELPKALDFLTSIYTPIAYYKDEGKEFDPKKHNKDRLLLYNAKDSLSAHIVNRKQDQELEESGQKELYKKEIAPLILIYKNLDETGILEDEDQKAKLRFKYVEKLNAELSILRALINNPKFNVNSTRQVGDLLYNDLRFPKKTKTNEKGEVTYKTDKDTLDELLIKHSEHNKMGQVGAVIIKNVILCRKLAKVIEVIETPIHPDGTLRGSSNLSGTETGRSSFSKTIDEILIPDDAVIKNQGKRVKRLGRSLQTISKHGFKIDDESFDATEDVAIAADLRSMFVPPKDFVFVEGDGSGAEARVVFVLAEDYEGLAAMDQKPKIHAKTAGLIFGIDPNIITKDGPSIPGLGMMYYDLGKRIRHAGNYDMTEFRLAQMTHIILKECRFMLEKFHEQNENIRGVYHKEVDENLVKHRILVTPFGRIIQFFERLNMHVHKKAKAYIPQSTISDQTKFSMPRIVDAFPGYMRDYRFATEQHDGILSIVRKSKWEAFAKTFKEIYERPISFRKGSLVRDYDLVVPAEMSMSEENWMVLKEVYV